MGGLLEKLVLRLVPEGKQPQREAELDERLLATPALALERCRTLIADMASYSMESLRESLNAITAYNQKPPNISVRMKPRLTITRISSAVTWSNSAPAR